MSGRALSTIIAMALAAGACTGGSSEKTEGLPAGHGGTLTLVMTNTGGSPYEPGDFDPQEAGYSSSFEMARCCLFRTLMSYNGKTTSEGGGTPRPDLAAALPTVSSDGLTWTFLIKPGLRYAPPLQTTEIVAQDVIRGIERALAPVKGKTANTICGRTPCNIGDYFASLVVGTIQGAQAYADGHATTISGLEAPDTHTLRVHLTHPSGDVAYMFALPATSPLPQKPGDPGAAFGVATGHNLDYGQGFAIASGPYMVEGSGALDLSAPPKQQLPATGAAKRTFTLVRNPSWDPASDDLRVAYPDRIVVVGSKGLDAGEAMVKKGSADLVFDFTDSPSLVARYQAAPDLRPRVFTDVFDAISVLTINVAVPPLDDVHVRRAINFAIDKGALRPILARHLTNSTIATHIGLDSEEENLLQNYSPFGNGTGDLQAAKSEMAQSRYARKGDQSCNAPACRGVTLAVPSEDPGRIAMANSIRADLRPLGIDVVVISDDAKWFAAGSDPSSGVPLALFRCCSVE